MSIRHRPIDVETLNATRKHTINETLGIRFTNVDEGSLGAAMPVCVSRITMAILNR